MKKLLTTLAVVSAMTLATHAAIILNEPFDYPDGSLAGPGNISGGVWTTHSGTTTGQVDVVSGVVNLTQSESEDISRLLPGGPYTTGNLYASFTVNFSTLPGGNGTYLFNYRDTGTMNFRARVFITSTNAGPGAFRVGITGGNNNPVLIPVDLELATEYKLVVRYSTTAGTATLWINPTSEGAITSRADSADAGSIVPIHFVCLRQAGVSPGMGTLTFDNLLIGSEFSDVQTVGGPPSISGLVNVSIPANANTGPMPFVVSDVETPAASLTVGATSDNTTLVPNAPANLTFGGSGGNRTLAVTPAAGQQGTANIQVVVTDGNNETATNSFTITVGLPTISPVANVIAAANSVSAPVVVTVGDNETAPGSLTVTATSSNPSVLPDDHIGIQVSGATRTLYLTNIGAGFAEVTVSVNDGTFNVPTTFTLTAYPENGVLMADDFEYADGSIVLNSTPLWTTHSANATGTNETQILGGKLYLTNNASEDINRWFTNAPVLNTSGQLIYTRFILNVSQLPTANGVGEYFTHVYGFSGAFRARVFASTNGAAPGKFRLAISVSSFTPVQFPQDLSPNQSYVVITRYNSATGESALWVDAASETSQNVSATDTASTITAYGIAFRQSTGIGSMTIDDLVVGSTFADVFTEPAIGPIPLQISLAGGNVTLTWANPAFKLYSASTVNGTYTEVVGATSPYSTPISGNERYFRLVYP
jgi:hypothetical protein